MTEVDGTVKACSSATAFQTHSTLVKHEKLQANSDGNNVDHSQLLDCRKTVKSDLQLTKLTIKMTITSLQFPR